MTQTPMEFPQPGTRVEIEEGKQFMSRFDPCFDDGELIPCVTQDWQTHDVLMLGWMNRETLARTLETGRNELFSRLSGNKKDLRPANRLWRH